MTILEKINDIFLSRRQQGHTEAVIRGAMSMGNCTIVAGTLSTADLIKQRIWSIDRYSKVRVISIHMLDTFRGEMPGPILLDNSVFFEMQSDINCGKDITYKEWNRTLQGFREKVQVDQAEIREHKEKIKELEFQLATSLILSKGTEIEKGE